MNLSLKAKYGVCAAFILAKHYDQEPVQIRQIAAEYDISHPFLDQIMGELKKTGLVTSFRGSKGGYALSKHPSQISVGDIVSTLDGPIDLSNRACGCQVLTQYWTSVEAQLIQALNMPLSTLVATSVKLTKTLTYTI